VPDATLDPRFACFPMVTSGLKVRFYAGALLCTPDGVPVGTLCVSDIRPRPQGLTALQRLALRTLADQVMGQMELRRMQREKQGLALALRAREMELRALAAADAGRRAAPAGSAGVSYVSRADGSALSLDVLSRTWPGPRQP
jgi:GAF domain-containing protein